MLKWSTNQRIQKYHSKTAVQCQQWTETHTVRLYRHKTYRHEIKKDKQLSQRILAYDKLISMWRV